MTDQDQPAVKTPQRIPAKIVGADVVATLHAEGHRIVPNVPTLAMRRAAGNAMRLRREAIGEQWVWASVTEKTAIRWSAMLDAWSRDQGGMKAGTPPVFDESKKPRWSWSLGRFFHIAVDWVIEREEKMS